MKRQAQEEIQAQWEKRKDEFDSYEDFLQAGLESDEWGRKMTKRFFGKKAGTSKIGERPPVLPALYEVT